MSVRETLHQDEDLTLDVAIDEPPQKLWRALTEPAIVKRWLAPVDTKTPGAGTGQSCELIAAEPNRSASYIWRDPEAGESMVTFAISERTDGFSRLSIVHTGLPRVFTVATAGALPWRMRLGAKTTPPIAVNRNQPFLPPLLLAA
ncbi:MAG: SRPBCC domain-containing protein [Rhizobiaceae bacterium]